MNVHLSKRVILAVLFVAVAVVACGDEPLLERFPAAAGAVALPGAELSTIRCDVDDFVFGGLGGPQVEEWHESAQLAADEVISRYSIRDYSSTEVSGSSVRTKLITYFDAFGTPIADIRVQQAAAGWYASGFQGCMDR